MDASLCVGRNAHFINTLGEYGLDLAEVLQDNQWSENHVVFLVDYLRNLLCIKTYNWIHTRKYSRSHKNTTELAKKSAFKIMHEYIDPQREGLEFIRVFLRTVLQEQEKEASASKRGKRVTLNYLGEGQKSPVYEGLSKVITVLSTCKNDAGKPHPALVAMTATSQHDTLLDDVLDALITLGHANEGKSISSSIKSTLDMFQQTLHALISHGLWTPSANIAARFWQLHRGLDKDAGVLAEKHEALFVKSMRGPQGEYLHLGLNYLLSTAHLRLSVLLAFFPLALTRCDVRATLFNLVQLLYEPADETWVERQWERAALLTEFIRDYHPQLSSLLELYAAVRSGQESLQECTDSMLESFARLCRGDDDADALALPPMPDLSEWQ